MAQYMLLLYDDDGMKKMFNSMSPEEMQKGLEKYMAWRKKPFTVDGKRLGEDYGKVLRVSGGKTTATDGPYSETKEILGGYYTIEAADYDEAVRISMTHPHLEHGGTIEVRHVYGT
jgi:hypothetical protein